MQDEVKVTVVATGLNRVAAKQSVRGQGYDRESQRAPIQLVRNATTGQPEFSAMDDMQSSPMPSFGGSLRGSSRAVETSAPAVADFGNDSSYLDIPAFLRRQAD
jgi:cell division protein FtsZ